MRRILVSLPILGALAAAGCSGGGGAAAAPGAAEFRLTTCSLGCGAGTCAANHIATNQDVTFTFNDQVDPVTVSFTTIPIVEMNVGSTPPGEFLVEGRKVTFRPALLETQTGIRFGFDEGGEYEITVYAAPLQNVVRSRMGRPNTAALRCIVTTSGIVDLVPGRPTVTFTPNPDRPPASRDFLVTMVFNDLMQTGQLVDPETGGSPTIRVLVVDEGGAQVLETAVDGTFAAQLDRNRLMTTVTFTPSMPWPGNGGGGRYLRLDFAAQIADLAGNTLANAGSYPIPLPPTSPTDGSFLESFDDFSQLDPAGSTSGLWGTPLGSVDSGLDPATSRHRGGGSGVLGPFRPTTSFVFDTDSTTLSADQFDIVTGQDVTITDGVFLFDEVSIPAGVTVTATGSKPLRLYSRGQFLVEGVLDVSGAPAPPNFGKYFPPDAENLSGEDQNRISSLEAGGGAPGLGGPGAGLGGRGGMSWYLVTEELTLPPCVDDFYDAGLPNYRSGAPDPARFADCLLLDPVHGSSGYGVGGRRSRGTPLGRPGDVALDRRYGAGIGSLAWPFRSNAPRAEGCACSQPEANRFRAHRDPITSAWLNYAIYRSRGGGGGGYWGDGEQGFYFEAGGVDPLGRPLPDPVTDPGQNVYEFNSLYTFDAKSGGPTPDAAGGDFDPGLFPGIETLDPDLGLLLGGSGGGGGGCSEHGSWSDDPAGTSGTLDTMRTCDGGGGGGGGGALQIHAGGRLAVPGAVRADGGTGADSEFMLTIPYSPPNAISLGTPGDAGGGGGSGGAVLVQVNDDLDEVRADGFSLAGGLGGLGSAGNHGGAGGAGVIRFETRTGAESLSDLQAVVAPDESPDLAPVGLPGQPNVARHSASIAVGDLTATFGGSTVTFNGNASGVRSLWFAPSATLLQLTIRDWRVVCEYDTGSGLQSLVYGPSSPTVPGTTPIWVAFQTGWGPPGATEPDADLVGDWAVPYSAAAGGGLPEIQSGLWRMIRFQIVFDQDQVAALIGSNPAAYFRVQEVRLDWTGD